MKLFLQLFLSAVWLYMVYVVVSTSLTSNLLKEWDSLAAIPWMRATLWDFYANVLVIFMWVVYKESKIWIMVVWATLFFCLGSIGTVAYVLIQLFRIKKNEPLSVIFIRNNN